MQVWCVLEKGGQVVGQPISREVETKQPFRFATEMAQKLAHDSTGTWAAVQVDGIVRDVEGVDLVKSVGKV